MPPERSDIQARLQRLRKAGRLRRTPRPSQPQPVSPPPASPPLRSPAHDAPANAVSLEALPGMREVAGERGRYLLRTLRYPLTHRQGRSSLGELLALPSEAAYLLAGSHDYDFRQAVFLDTETSGLAGGAGTIVFLTGVGVFEDDEFVVRQYFARNPAEEQAYLPDLARFVAARGGLVTFNGRSFDWPLLRSRFILAGVIPPDETPHVDLLHHARRLWRQRLTQCNFGNLERHILDYQRSSLDIPSYMIPGLWFRFARGQGNGQEMAAVLYHNQEDIVSMAPLAHIIAATLAGAMNPQHPHDWLSLARVWQNNARPQQAETAYRQALAKPLPPALRAQALRELALLLKRHERHAEAAILWQALAELNPPRNVEALVELAKYHEWRTHDLPAAQTWTEEAIRRVETWPRAQRQSILPALIHRQQRLRRKKMS